MRKNTLLLAGIIVCLVFGNGLCYTIDEAYTADEKGVSVCRELPLRQWKSIGGSVMTPQYIVFSMASIYLILTFGVLLSHYVCRPVSKHKLFAVSCSGVVISGICIFLEGWYNVYINFTINTLAPTESFYCVAWIIAQILICLVFVNFVLQSYFTIKEREFINTFGNEIIEPVSDNIYTRAFEDSRNDNIQQPQYFLQYSEPGTQNYFGEFKLRYDISYM